MVVRDLRRSPNFAGELRNRRRNYWGVLEGGGPVADRGGVRPLLAVARAAVGDDQLRQTGFGRDLQARRPGPLGLALAALLAGLSASGAVFTRRMAFGARPTLAARPPASSVRGAGDKYMIGRPGFIMTDLRRPTVQ